MTKLKSSNIQGILALDGWVNNQCIITEYVIISFKTSKGGELYYVYNFKPWSKGPSTCRKLPQVAESCRG